MEGKYKLNNFTTLTFKLMNDVPMNVSALHHQLLYFGDNYFINISINTSSQNVLMLVDMGGGAPWIQYSHNPISH